MYIGKKTMEIIKNNIEKDQALQILTKVNKMADRGDSIQEIQMFLFNNWVKYTDEEQVNKDYETL